MAAFGIMVACSIVYAFIPIMAKASRPCPPFLLVGLASAFEAVLSGLIAWGGGDWQMLSVTSNDTLLAILAGACVSVAGAYLVIRGYDYMPIWRHQLFILIKPLIAGFAAWIWFGEMVGWTAAPAFALMAAGLLIAFNGWGKGNWHGAHILIGASAFYALLPVCLKIAVDVVPPFVIVSLLSAGISVLSLLLSVVFERNRWFGAWKGRFLWQLPMLGITNALAVWLSLKGLELLPVWQHQMILLTKPVIAALIARVVFTEPLTRRYVPAFLLMATGASVLIIFH